MKRIVCDASPLIVLARSELLWLLPGIGQEIIVPETVFRECTLASALPGAVNILAASQSDLLHIRPDVELPRTVILHSQTLDAGERAAIAMALALQCPLLIDERHGRQVARHAGVAVIGSVGLLLGAKKRGLVSEIAPILKRWKEYGYYLSASLLEVALLEAGESSRDCSPGAVVTFTP